MSYWVDPRAIGWVNKCLSFAFQTLKDEVMIDILALWVNSWVNYWTNSELILMIRWVNPGASSCDNWWYRVSQSMS